MSVTAHAGTNLTEVYAVIVSFGVYFNGTTLDQIAALVGVQASPYQILSNLVRCGAGSETLQAYGSHAPAQLWPRHPDAANVVPPNVALCPWCAWAQGCTMTRECAPLKGGHGYGLQHQRRRCGGHRHHAGAYRSSKPSGH